MAAPLVDELETVAATGDIDSGRLDADGVRCSWDADGVRIECADGSEFFVDEEAPVTIQLSRWRRPTRPSLWMQMRGITPVPVHELHAELRRSDGLRLPLMADCEPDRVAGLPWLSRTGGEEVDASSLLALVEACAAQGSRVASWQDDALEPPPVPETRSVSFAQMLRALTGDFLAAFGAVFLIVGLPAVLTTWLALDGTDSLFALIGLIFPVVGGIFFFLGLRRWARAVHLLRHGHITMGELISKKRTHMRINEKPVYKLTFSFTSEDGTAHTCEIKTHKPWRLLDEPRERILYDADEPSIAVPADGLPGGLGIGPDGEVTASGPATSGPWVWVAVIVVTMVIYAVFVL